MRRSAATTWGAPSSGLPFTVGQDPLASAPNTSVSNGSLWVSALNPAPRAGVLNTVKAFVLNTGSIAAVTGTLSGTTFTVKQVLTLTATTSNAVNTFTGQALPIASGDLIAYWSASSGPALYRSGTDVSGSSYRAAATSLPTVGQSFTVSSLTNLLMLQATGS